MMDESKISQLDKEAKLYREEKVGKEKYTMDNEYSSDNDAARTHDDEFHPHGKGTGVAMTYVVKKPKANGIHGYQNHDFDRNSIRTDEGGGSYDKFGTKGVEGAFQGDSGRAFAEKINQYGKDREYGSESVDIDTSVRGQFIVK